jgi:topoisomerase-4 subunit A
MVTKVDTKPLGRILFIAILTKGQAYIYNLIYRDGKSGPSYKEFNVSGVTR